MEKDKILWNILKKHIGHSVHINSYGECDNPDSICLECYDCNEIILDAEFYTICAREDVFSEFRGGTMEDLISRNELLEKLHLHARDWKSNEVGSIMKSVINDCVRIVKTQPTIREKQDEVGRWIRDDIFTPPYCSICGGVAPVDCDMEEFYESDYCPSCGCNMWMRLPNNRKENSK